MFSGSVCKETRHLKRGPEYWKYREQGRKARSLVPDLIMGMLVDALSFAL